MYQIIQEKLTQIEQDTPLKLLLAVESGSRAWGFPSPDSDYDVRTIFIRPQKDYLAVNEPKNTFEYIENQWFDVGGWDLRKTLYLFRKSNAVLLEWLHSPLVYRQDQVFIDEIKALLPDYFQAAPVVHHYKGIAKNALSGLNFNGQVKIKKWLYVLCPLLAALWAANKKSVPPIELSKLSVDFPVKINNELKELIELKATKNESYLHQLSPAMIKLTYDLWNLVESTAVHVEHKSLPFKSLNELFYRTLMRIEAECCSVSTI